MVVVDGRLHQQLVPALDIAENETDPWSILNAAAAQHGRRRGNGSMATRAVLYYWPPQQQESNYHSSRRHDQYGNPKTLWGTRRRWTKCVHASFATA
jgi:hypothetical protein